MLFDCRLDSSEKKNFRAFLHASVMFVQSERLSDWRFEHRLATSDTLASVTYLHHERMSDWSFGHPLAIANTLTLVM